MESIHRRWEKPVNGNVRYYQVWLHQDLWHDWVITRVWGRKNSPAGQVRNTPVVSYQQGLQVLHQVTLQRQRRCYTLV